MAMLDTNEYSAYRCEFFRCRYFKTSSIDCLQHLCEKCRFGHLCVHCGYHDMCPDEDERVKKQLPRREGDVQKFADGEGQEISGQRGTGGDREGNERAVSSARAGPEGPGLLGQGEPYAVSFDIRCVRKREAVKAFVYLSEFVGRGEFKEERWYYVLAGDLHKLDEHGDGRLYGRRFLNNTLAYIYRLTVYRFRVIAAVLVRDSKLCRELLEQWES